MRTTFNTLTDIAVAMRSPEEIRASVAAAEKRGRDEYYAWFKPRQSTCIDGTGPQNPYEGGTLEHAAYRKGSWDAYNDCVLVEMGR